MSTTILQKFVDNNIFTLRSDDDFAKLKEAANNLSKSELKQKEALPAYILTAFDPNIPTETTTLEKTQELVIKQSPTVLSQSKDKPRVILRAVILEALYTRALNDLEYARIIWLSTISVINHFDKGNEQDLLISILQEIGEKVEHEAVKNWSTTKKINITPFEKATITIGQAKSIQSAIDGFKESFGESVQYTNNNPSHWNHVNSSVSTFVSNLRKNGGDEIASLVSKSHNSYKDMFNKMSSSLTDFLSEIEPYLTQISTEVVGGVSAVNNRSELLWWKESLYSRSTVSSYRELDTNHVSVIMAFDLHLMVNQVYPVSIDYFLRETIYKLIPKGAEKLSLEKFVFLFSEGTLKEYLIEAKINLEHSEERVTLLQYLNSFVNDQIKQDSILQQLGIDPKTEFDVDDFAVWLFHDLQAYKTMKN